MSKFKPTTVDMKLSTTVQVLRQQLNVGCRFASKYVSYYRLQATANCKPFMMFVYVLNMDVCC